MSEVIGRADLVILTLDTLRYDVAAAEFAAGRTPVLAELIGPGGWQRRHTPASFTYAAHLAFLAGFLPTPAEDPSAPRLFAVSFAQSRTTGPDTWVTEHADLAHGLAAVGYRTICIGGTGFFDPSAPLGGVLTGMFQQAHWAPELGVTNPQSLDRQLDLAERLLPVADPQPVFLLLNVAALHQPNWHYLPGAEPGIDTIESHAAALRYVDAALPRLVRLLTARERPSLLLLMSDHGTAYGEDGYHGHRLGHPVVWTVPYAQVWLP